MQAREVVESVNGLQTEINADK